VILYDQHIPLHEYSDFVSEQMMPFDGRSLTKQVLLETGARALFVRSVTKVNQELIAGTQLRFVGTTTAGYEHIDIEALRKRGIAFAYAPGSNAMPVAEYVFFALHEWSKRIQCSLQGKTIGIIGMGEIGKRIAHICVNIGMQVIASDPPLEVYGFKPMNGVKWVPLTILFEKSDCITIHSALTQDGIFPTANLIHAEQFEHMKSGALLIHAARGGIVHEPSLVKALNEKNLNLAIDVWEHEPLWNEQIAMHPNAFMTTPHIAGYTGDARKRGIEMIIKQYCTFLGISCDTLKAHDSGISFQDSKALSLLKERRFSDVKMHWLKEKTIDPRHFDAGRRECMQDEETLADVLAKRR
jgi:erythronate-4-phosphate dehydrogenase